MSKKRVKTFSVRLGNVWMPQITKITIHLWILFLVEIWVFQLVGVAMAKLCIHPFCRQTTVAFLQYLIWCSVMHSIRNTLSFKLHLMYAVHRVYEAFINCIPFRQPTHQTCCSQKFSEFKFFFIRKNEDREFQVRKFIKIYLMEVKFLCKMPTINAWCIQNLCLPAHIAYKYREIYKQFTKICVQHKTNACTVRLCLFVQLYVCHSNILIRFTRSACKVQDCRNERWFNVCVCSVNYNRSTFVW